MCMEAPNTSCVLLSCQFVDIRVFFVVLTWIKISGHRGSIVVATLPQLDESTTIRLEPSRYRTKGNGRPPELQQSSVSGHTTFMGDFLRVRL